jgi:hypothetical protein
MNYILKILTIVAIITGLSILANTVIPVTFTTNINNSIIYFLSTLNYLQAIFPVATLFTCLSILVNFFYGVMLFIVGKWIVGIIMS